MPASCALLDGELVAFVHGKPDFPLVCECVLHRHASIPLTFIAFDVLSVDGHSVVRASSLKRGGSSKRCSSRGRDPPRACASPVLLCAITFTQAQFRLRLASRFLRGERPSNPNYAPAAVEISSRKSGVAA